MPIASGRIACITCHERCGSKAPRGARARGLRGTARGEAFCAQCHRARTGAASRALPGPPGPEGPRLAVRRRGPAAHARMFAIAHPAASSGSPAAGAAPSTEEPTPAAAAGSIDDTSLRCLSCHDGTAAPDAAGDGAGAPQIGSGAASHPIGTAYPPRPKPGGEGTFRPAASLDPRMVLPDGRVGCLTCHDIFGGEEKLLAMSNRGSQLCCACHEI